MVKVESRVQVIECKGVPKEDLVLAVLSDGLYPDRVVLRLPSGVEYTVLASDMKAAIDNATNTNRLF